MSEAIIARGGMNARKLVEDAINETFPATLQTELITNTRVWQMPGGIVNNTIHVRIFGGGGGGNYAGGGGGGWMNNADITIIPGENVIITIGDGGTQNNSGGTTSFGRYLSANGGEAPYLANGGNGGSGGYGQDNGGIGYQFGGGGSGSGHYSGAK